MSNKISYDNASKNPYADNNGHKPGAATNAPAQSSTSGYSEQSGYASKSSDSSWSAKSWSQHDGMPYSEAAKDNQQIRDLVHSYSGKAHHHRHGGAESGSDSTQSGSSNSSGLTDSSATSGTSDISYAGPSSSLSSFTDKARTSDSAATSGGSAGTASSASSGGTASSASTPSGVTASGSGGTTSSASTASSASVSSSDSTSSAASGMGVQINWAAGDSVAAYEQRTGIKPASIGGYISASNGTLDMADAEKYIKEAGSNGVPTMVLSINSSEPGAMSQQELAQFTQLSQEAKSQGVNLQVRFGYEMNLSAVSNFTDPAVFKQQWAQVADAVHAGGGTMNWCPSNSTTADYEKWMPDDPSTIDVVGLDVYHMGSGAIGPDEVKNAISGIEAVPGLSGKPLTLPETGVQLTGDGSDASKVSQWLSELSDPALKAQFPNYQGFLWFDYNKPGDGNYALSQNSQYEQALTQWASS